MKHIWWNQVTNAVQYVSQITNSLLEEKSILLRYASCMPWHEELETSIIEAVKQQNSEKKFVKIPAVCDPGAYILREFCKPEKRAAYRPVKGYPKFFAESDDIVLHDRYLWVKIEDAKSLENWLAFVSEYVKERGKKNSALFILEWAGEQPSVKKGVKVFSFEDYIGEYDRIVFAVLASSGIKEIPFIKSYLSELVAQVAGNDIELCAECIIQYKSFLENPIALIRKVCDVKTRCNGTEFIIDKSEDEVERLIWRAQIKTIYPHIEEFREDFIHKHSSAISKQLPISASCGETYNEPEDVELGTLKYMADMGYLSLNSTEHGRLKKYKEARNKLSHLTTLSIDEINGMLI